MKCSQNLYTHIQCVRAALCNAVLETVKLDAGKNWQQLLAAVKHIPLATVAIEGWLRSFQPGIQKLDRDDRGEINPFYSLLSLSPDSPRRSHILKYCCQELDDLQIDLGLTQEILDDDFPDTVDFGLDVDDNEKEDDFFLEGWIEENQSDDNPSKEQVP